MLSVCIGSQADEAWHSDAAAVHGDGVFSVRSKVYVSPKLWYLRVHVIEAQDVEGEDRSQPPPAVFVKGVVGKTKIFPNRTANPVWNEDLLFVVAEPFEDVLVVTIESKVAPTRDEVVGRMSVSMNALERRMDHRLVHSRWFNLDRFGMGEYMEGKGPKFSTRIHLRGCLEGGYHVLDESTLYISDQRPTTRQLWKQPIGIL
ncbi:hypothetical protein SASPL_140999 [Salvia splendens]|uniref:C2 domain-containing protein n=1 Tax=Salvia splendens TaxID=180675 RepID=A0A8X8WQT2_SALSN|nr:hypothetical protein SASPL_140999 [Salvia splendens]